MKKIFFCTACLLTCCFQYLNAQLQPKPEVIYQLCTRTFNDTNKDSIGDLNGVYQKLGYLQELGVTSVLLLPLQDSATFQNKSVVNIKPIDEKYGTAQDFVKLARAMHNRGMNLYLDMEVQFTPQDNNQLAENADAEKVFYTNSGNQKSIVQFKNASLTSKSFTENGGAAYSYYYRVFSYFVDPNNDGLFDDGADGFMLKNMADNVTGKPGFNNLLRTYWKPLIIQLKQQNPKLKITGEQANRNSFGTQLFSKAGIDRITGFRLQEAFSSFSKEQILAMTDATFDSAHGNQNSIVFTNYTAVPAITEENLEQAKATAALDLLVGGTALINCGQEVGASEKLFNNSDTAGQHLSKLLFDYYKTLIDLRNNSKPLSIGTYRHLDNDNDSIFTFIRKFNGKRVAVAINLSGEAQRASWEMNGNIDKFAYQSLFGNEKLKFEPNKLILILPPYGVSIWEER